VGAADTTYSPRGVASMEDAALKIAEQVIENPQSRARLVPCAPSAAVDAACSRAVVRRLGRLAWRRPLTDAELERVAGVGDAAARTLGDFHGGLVYAVAALLQSPYFVFRVELGQGEGEARAFDAYELASRLSFFLWNTTPDEALLDRAADGTLSTDAGLRAEATRLLDSPRAREGLSNFFAEQFGLYALDTLAKDPKLFEHFDAQLGPDAREETLRLLLSQVLDADADFREVLTTRRTFLNPRLAALYGVPAPSPDGFREVDLPESAHRAGLLSHASVLNLYAHQVSSSATLRGKFVRTVLLCQPVPAPPVNVDTSIPAPSGTTRTLRERVAEHLENPSCAGCHTLLDPIGLGLENYDAIGRFRETDNDERIDPTGTLDGVDFADAKGLGQALAEHEAFAPCVVRTLVRYASGHVEAAGEQAAVEALADRFAALDYRVKPLLLEIVMSPLFRRAGALR
jgi:PAS domain-containing protein